MINFKKAYSSLKVICLIISIEVLFNCNAYSKDGLRLPLGDSDDTLGRVKLTELIQVSERHLRDEIVKRKHAHIPKVISFMEHFVAYDFDMLYETFDPEIKTAVDKREYKKLLEELFFIYQNLSPKAKEVLKVATVFHDIGAIKTSRD